MGNVAPRATSTLPTISRHPQGDANRDGMGDGPSCGYHLLSSAGAHQLICEHYKKLDAEMPPSVEPPFKPLRELGFVPLRGDPQYVTASFDVANRDAAEYEHNRKQYDEITAKTESSRWENAYLAMGPLLLAVAVALRITKTSGEIRNAKRKP